MEGNPDRTFTVARVVPAPRETVFRAWTRPAELEKWWSIGEGWKTRSAEVDLRAGGKFSLLNEPLGGDAVMLTGEFLAVEPPQKLVYTWRFPGIGPKASTITVEFRDLGPQTEVAVTHAHASQEMIPGAIEGWEAALAGLLVFLSRLPKARHDSPVL
ncbi:MAG: SRPBCC domain-containing protein [Nitrososphaerota archaeon]|nr:SRPBCC domain-containing protein [Nitrososphaerota archaeon]